jgi:hypothetical protein
VVSLRREEGSTLFDTYKLFMVEDALIGMRNFAKEGWRPIFVDRLRFNFSAEVILAIDGVLSPRLVSIVSACTRPKLEA